MNSFVQANEQTGIDFTSINPKLRQPAKTYSFFIYHRCPPQAHSHLQRLAFRLQEERSWGWQRQQARQVQLFFVDCENEGELEHSFFDLKMQLVETPKVKLVCYTHEQQLIAIHSRALALGIDLSQVPTALYAHDLHGDLAHHLGWREGELGDLSGKASCEFEENVRKWISSPGERIDLWEATLTVDPEQGRILRLDPSTNAFLPLEEKTLSLSFLSYLVVGHHAHLAANYLHRHQNAPSLLNRLLFALHSAKKFCCLGKPSLEEGTGLVELSFTDEKGHSVEIAKQVGGKRGVASVVLSNIDRFQGGKLEGGKMNDGKLELGVVESSSEWRLITSVGAVEGRLRGQVWVGVGGECLRLQEARTLRVAVGRKLKVLINKETLEC